MLVATVAAIAATLCARDDDSPPVPKHKCTLETVLFGYADSCLNLDDRFAEHYCKSISQMQCSGTLRTSPQ
jgi:hypothetical protein